MVLSALASDSTLVFGTDWDGLSASVSQKVTVHEKAVKCFTDVSFLKVSTTAILSVWDGLPPGSLCDL